jgi:phosphate transport system substrate-binding protein
MTNAHHDGGAGPCAPRTGRAFRDRGVRSNACAPRLVLRMCSLLVGALLAAPAADITVVGSSTVGDVLARVAQAWRAQGNDAIVAITGSGSNSALPALAAGTATFATSSRPLTRQEIDAYTAAHGPLTTVVIAYDALAVFVHRDNPLPAITLAQLDAAFGAERRRGLPAIRQWGELGLAAPWTARPLALIGSGPHGGAHALMRELLLQGGTFTALMAQEPVTSSIVQGVGTDPAAIGCASAALLSRRTRIVPVGETTERALLPTAATCRDGSYPLARPLILCWNPQAAMSAQARAFFDFVVSPDGQEIIANSGCFPLGRTAELENHVPVTSGK